MAKQKIKSASRRERRKEGKQHGGWDYNKKVKGDSWNARYHDGHGNQVGDRNPQERLFGPGESDRPADVKQNVTSAYISDGRGNVPQGTTAATQRPSIENWYHTSSKYSNPGLTKDTTPVEWNITNKKQL